MPPCSRLLVRRIDLFGSSAGALAVSKHARSATEPLVGTDWPGSAPGSISRLLPISTASRVDEAEEDLADTLGCAVCLDVVHNAFGLACGHYCCARCLQQIARLPPGGDLQQAPASRRCPQCRQPGVFKEAMPLPQLNTLVRRRLGEKAYRQRKQREKRELQEARDEHDLQTNPMNALLALYAGGRSQ